jgi:D-glycero-alpha-D-manno-heptose-7-phosphate kinase
VLDLRVHERGLASREAIAVAPELLELLASGMLLIDTGQRRVSGEVIARARYAEGETAELVQAAGDVAAGLREGSLAKVVAAMRRSAAAKAARDPEGNAGARALAERLEPLGAQVVRHCGAGGGGHVLVWAPEDRHDAILGALGEPSQALAGQEPRVRRPALGAHGVRVEDETPP